MAQKNIVTFKIVWEGKNLSIEKIQKLMGSKEWEKHYGLKIAEILEDKIVEIGWSRSI
jgi:hypothetical protein